MGKKKLRMARQLQRIVALPYNPYLDEQVGEIRQKYSIPVDRKKASDWFYLEYAMSYRKCAYPLFIPRGQALFLQSKEVKTIYDTEVPLEREILILLQRFQLPDYVFESLLRYVIGDDKISLDPLAFEPKVEFDWDYRKGLPELKVTIAGLSHLTTEKQWKQIWNRQVKQRINRAKEDYKEVFGIAGSSRKRITLESYREQIKRWSEWYQLSEIQGLGPTGALKKWEKDHPDECGKFEVSTVTHAIKEFGEIIRPSSLAEE